MTPEATQGPTHWSAANERSNRLALQLMAWTAPASR